MTRARIMAKIRKEEAMIEDKKLKQKLEQLRSRFKTVHSHFFSSKHRLKIVINKRTILFKIEKTVDA